MKRRKTPQNLGWTLLIGILTTACTTLPPETPVPAAETGQNVQLTVRFEGVDAAVGQIVGALYTSEASFERGDSPYRSLVQPVEGASPEWRLDLPAGEYAIKAYWDLDRDRVLDRTDFGVPIEPYGFSNNARGAFGPPSWEKTRFKLGPDGLTLSIELR